MTHRVEIRPRDGFSDPHADGVHHQIAELGIDSVQAVRHVKLYFLFGELSDEQARQVAGELLADPVTETFALGSADSESVAVVEVHLQPGVMDPVAGSAEQAIRDMGLDVRQVRTGRRYELVGSVSDAERETIARRLLANAVIEDVYFDAHTPEEVHGHSYKLEVVHVPIRDLDESGLEKLSREGDLFLNLTE